INSANRINYSTPIRKNIPILLTLVVLFQNPVWFIWKYAYLLMFGTLIILFCLLLKDIFKKSGEISNHLLIILLSFLFFVVFNSIYSLRMSSLFSWLIFV